MRAAIIVGLMLLAWSPSARAGDCQYWNRLPPADRITEIESMINGHLESNTSRKYTSENKANMRRCLREFIPQIVEQIDQACADRPGASDDYVDDIFDKFLLSCI
jgi:hypothetical protein